uniref:Uncharacterized protein n=1 Tax=Anguilla anguilla TaxID=7936 RepID=A0A0E9V1Q7_ANGAN
MLHNALNYVNICAFKQQYT